MPGERNVLNEKLDGGGAPFAFAFRAEPRRQAHVVHTGRGDSEAARKKAAHTMTPSTQPQAVVATYDSHAKAESAIRSLQQSGFDMKRLSIIGKDVHTEEHALGFYTSGDRIKIWGGRGAFWGSLWGLLFGGAVFFIPAIGPLVVMGPLVGWIVGALEGATLGGVAGVLAAAFTNLGIPKDSVVKYELEVKTGKYLLLAQGTPATIGEARRLLGTTGALDVVTHALERQEIMSLLSDEEIARVSTAEAGSGLAMGDEYLDLEHLGKGVYRVTGTMPPVGRLLPRSAVHQETWAKLLTHLASMPAAAAPPV